MLNDFTVRRRVSGPIASLDADRVEPGDGDGATLDEGGGDGSQPLDDDASLDGSEDGDAGADEATRTASGDESDEHDDDDDDSDRYEGLPAEERIKKLLESRKKLRRKLAKRTPVYTQVQDLARRGVTLEDLLVGNRQYQQLATKIQQSPRLRALIEGGEADDDRRPAARDARPRQDAEDFQFDDSVEALGFDPKDSPANKAIAAGLRRAALVEHRLNALLSRLDPDALVRRVDGIERGVRQTVSSSIAEKWDAEIGRAEALITDPNPTRQKGLRTMFRDNCRVAMRAGRYQPRDITTHYLKGLGIDPAKARPATAAARSTHQLAQNVTRLARQPSSSGVPAPARNKKELLSDVSKRLRGQVGAGTR